MEQTDNTKPIVNATPLPENIKPVVQVKTGIPNPTGKGGFQDHPELINRNGRPKHKTITEVLKERLAQPLPDHPDKDGYDVIVNILLELVTKRKDKEMIKEMWHYLDGMPKQSTDITSGGNPLPQPIYNGKSTE